MKKCACNLLTRIFHQSASFHTQAFECDDEIGPLPNLRFVLPPALRLPVGSFVPNSHMLPQECASYAFGREHEFYAGLDPVLE